MTGDPQDQAEALDEDVVVAADDRSGDVYGDGLQEYPPEQPLGSATVGNTPVEEDAGESFAERDTRYEDEPNDRRVDEEPDPVSDRPELRGVGAAPSAEEDAMHVERTTVEGPIGEASDDADPVEPDSGLEDDGG